jgi:hypothetical protein
VAGYSATSTPEERLFICTGGGPGIMEAANRGAHDLGALTVGLNIALPHEQQANPYVSPSLSFKFHYFALRKMHFMMRAKALVAFPGGFGTLDELFEVITLVQTRKARPVPIVLCGSGRTGNACSTWTSCWRRRDLPRGPGIDPLRGHTAGRLAGDPQLLPAGLSARRRCEAGACRANQECAAGAQQHTKLGRIRSRCARRKGQRGDE